MNVRYTKQLITSVVAAGILLKVLLSSNDLISKIIVIPFLIFAVAFAIRNILIMMERKSLAEKFSKICTIAFLIYWFGFLIYWDYVGFTNGDYMSVAFSAPFWIAGIYFAYKRLVKIHQSPE